jgi:prepilin-type N-terminal cleavage/methylation domain-containing protein
MNKGWVMKYKKTTGFTIVELLIVIVVIGILAAITVVAYSGVQNRASDTAIQTDLRNIGGKIMEFKAINDAQPTGNTTDFGPMNIKVARSSYGAHYTPSGSSGYNLLYCSNGSTFAVVAASRSGNVFVFKDGVVGEGVGPMVTHTTTCANNGVSSGGTWFFSNGVWQSWVG